MGNQENNKSVLKVGKKTKTKDEESNIRKMLENLKIEKVKIYKKHFRNPPIIKDPAITNSERKIVAYLRRTEKIYLTKNKIDSMLFKYKKYNLKFEPGIPDYSYKKNGEVIFVECKTINDGLRYSQLEWIRKHPDYLVRVIFAEIIGR